MYLVELTPLIHSRSSRVRIFAYTRLHTLASLVFCYPNSEMLSIHYFHTGRMRHWIEQEVFLCPELLIIKVYASIANIGIDLIPSKYPTAAAFGDIALPAAFISGQPMGTKGILKYLHTLHDQEIPDTCLSTWAAEVLSDAIEYTLWAFPECVKHYTWPIMKDSLPRPFADLYMIEKRKLWQNRSVALINSRLNALFKQCYSNLLKNRFMYGSDKPGFTDIVLYSYLSVWVSIPEKISPFNTTDSETLERLKSFLLDFDDWLWHHGRNNTDKPLIESAQTTHVISTTTIDEQTIETKDNTPFLGKDPETRKGNVVFLTFVAVTMGAIGYFAA